MPTIIFNGREVQVKDSSPLLKNHTPVPTPNPTPNQATGASYTPPAQPKVSTPVPQSTSTPNPNFNPSYGSNIVGFDPNNQQHTALADAGQQWAAANRAGDAAGMAAAAKLGEQIRAGMGGASYDASKGLTTVPTPQPMAQPQVSGYTAAPQNTGDAVYNARGESQLQQQAGDGLAIDRAALLNAVNTQMTALRNNFNFANQNMNDQRVLEDAQINRTLNPFSGRTGYAKTQIARGRGIDDTYRNADMNNQLNALSTEIANFDKLAPERQRQIFNELLQLERNFALNQSNVTGMYGGQQTMAARNADRNYGLDYASQFGTLPGNASGASGSTGASPMTLAAKGQEFNQNMATQQFQYQQTRDQRKDFESDRLFDYGVYRDNVGDTQWQKQFEQSTQQFAQQMGYNWESLNQRDRQFMAEMTAREADKQFQQAQVQFGQGMEVFKQTGQMPSYMSNYGIDVQGMNDQAIKDDLTAMYTMIGQGAKPKDLIKTIDEKVTMGIETKENGEKIKQSLYKLYPDLDPANKQPAKSSFSLDNAWIGPSLADIDKATGLSKFAKWWNESVLGF